MKNFFWVLLAALLTRLVLANFGTLALDQNTFIAWSHRLLDVGFSKFYQAWCDYLPGYLYILWFLGIIEKVFRLNPELVYKIPAIVSDLSTGILIFEIVKRQKSEKWAFALSFLYLFNPAILANSTLWGQVDSLTAFFSLLAVWLVEKNLLGSAIFWAYGISIKPQVIFVAPVIAFLMFKRKWPLRRYILYGFTSLSVFVITFLPFSGGQNLFLFIFSRLAVSLNQYPYSSVNAFNFWGLFGFWKPDNIGGALSLQFIGYYVSFLLISIFLWRSARLKFQYQENYKYLFSAVLFLTTSLFFTRIHERHLLPAFAPLLVSTVCNLLLFISYFGLSLTYTLNLIYSYFWISENFKEVYSHFFIDLLIFLNLFFLAIVFYQKKFKIKKQTGHIFSKISLKRKSLGIILLTILTFSLASRILFLDNPRHEYFDEVYHAFTARRILHWDPKAWEWWNTPPAGFAYEWTHPPLAKEVMVVGMLIFGENSFGWRAPEAILGTLSVLLIFFISKELFKDNLLALFSASIFALDGLPLVVSRIGMNDSYFLFFILSCLLFFIKESNFFSAACLGFAAASKWTVFWFIPILVIAHFSLKKKFFFTYFWFLILPPLIYLSSYIPMFFTGHDWETFIEVQKQMWWYHTRLRATHPYTSPWWSWPIMLRPIWLYTKSYPNNLIENIYAMGNPIVFWSGILAFFYSLYLSLVHRSRKIGFVSFSYLALFVPWAFSPRIMFLYHYLPSIPFMSILIAILLRRNKVLVLPFFAIAIFLFIYFYPHWVGLKIPLQLDESYYWFSSWR